MSVLLFPERVDNLIEFTNLSRQSELCEGTIIRTFS